MSGHGTTILDMEGHGTHVSGTVGEETNNGVMLAGHGLQDQDHAGQSVRQLLGYSVFALGAGYSWTRAAGLRRLSGQRHEPGIRYAADNGAKVINFSIGGPGQTPLLRDAISYAVGKGVFVAMSAGNSYDTGNAPDYPARYAETIAGAMAVASVGRSLRHAYYSTSGSYVEIAAPGGDQLEGGLAGGIWQSTIRAADSDPETILFLASIGSRRPRPRAPRWPRRTSRGWRRCSSASSARARRPRWSSRSSRRPPARAVAATASRPTCRLPRPAFHRASQERALIWCRPDSASSRLVRFGAQKVGAMRRMLLSIGLCAASLLSASLAAAQATQIRRRSWSVWNRRRCARNPRSTRRPWRR